MAEVDRFDARPDVLVEKLSRAESLTCSLKRDAILKLVNLAAAWLEEPSPTPQKAPTSAVGPEAAARDVPSGAAAAAAAEVDTEDSQQTELTEPKAME
eukprot:5808477-Lingulodinium_polyedra.AAC.1